MMKTAIFCVFSLSANMAYASHLSDWFLRTDQQAAHALASGKAEQAAEQFQDPKWRAVAQYRAEHYRLAEQNFARLPTLDNVYNRGNALAQQGDYSAAIHVYDQVLKRDPKHADARFNRDLLKKLIEEKKQPPQPQPDKSSPDPKSSSGASNPPANPPSTQNKQEPQNKPAPSQPNTEQKQAPLPPFNNQVNNSFSDTKKVSADKQQEEQHQANAQWLRQIPDDPGGLLRQKFLRDHQRWEAEGRREDA